MTFSLARPPGSNYIHTGSHAEPCILRTDAGIAQLVEQLICNHQAPSSNLGAGTIFPQFWIRQLQAFPSWSLKVQCLFHMTFQSRRPVAHYAKEHAAAKTDTIVLYCF